MATNTDALKAAYAKRNKALETAEQASNEELEAQGQEIQRDTQNALQKAYIENVRASHRAGQANRAAGISGGQAIAQDIGRENAYGATRTDLQLQRETQMQSLANQKTLNSANTAADIAANDLSLQGDLLNVQQSDEDHQRTVYANMLSGGYIPENSAEANKMAQLFGIPLESLQAYVKKLNENNA